MGNIETASNGRRNAELAQNWTPGANGMGWSQRRRLMAVLRRAHRVLGMKRDTLGLGALGGGSHAALLS